MTHFLALQLIAIYSEIRSGLWTLAYHLHRLPAGHPVVSCVNSLLNTELTAAGRRNMDLRENDSKFDGTTTVLLFFFAKNLNFSEQKAIFICATLLDRG